MDQQSLESFLGQSTENQNPLGSPMNDLFGYIALASIVLTVLFLGLWVTGWLHRRKVENAIIDIRNTLQEMNEREKTRHVPSPSLDKIPRDTTRHIAVAESPSSDEAA